MKEKLIKIGVKVVSHDLYAAFQMAEAAIPRICLPDPAADHGTATAFGSRIGVRRSVGVGSKAPGEVCLDGKKNRHFRRSARRCQPLGCMGTPCRTFGNAKIRRQRQSQLQQARHPMDVGSGQGEKKAERERMAAEAAAQPAMTAVAAVAPI